MDFEIECYKIKDDDKISVIEEFLTIVESKYGKKCLMKILERIELLKINGSKLRRPYSERIAYDKKTSINCLRIESKEMQFRIFYDIIGNKIILLSGYRKDQQKTNKSELKKAVKYLKDYIERSKS